MNCPKCNEELESHSQKYQRCVECSIFFHFCGQNGWKKVPFLDSKTMKLSPWNGLGNNFLDNIRNSPTSGFLMTRKRIVWLITSGSYHSSKAKNMWMTHFLDEYGLEFITITDYQKYPDETEKNYIGFICILDSSKDFNFPLLKNSESNTSKVKKKYTRDRVNVKQITGIIQKMMGDKNLRIKQIEGIESILTNPVTTVILPTGYGKTKIAQSSIISRLIADKKNTVGPTLIVYPTISLIHDQRNAWEKELRKEIENYNDSNPKKTLRIPKTLFLTSDYKEKYNISSYSIFSKLIDGEYDVLCCSPEFIFDKRRGTNLLDIIPQMKVPFSNIIIDEVHTFFDWGDAIRLDYLLLPIVESLMRYINPHLHTIFMTATLHPRDERRLIKLFDLDMLFSSNQSIRHDEIREDLAFTVIKIPNKKKLIPDSCKIILEQSNKINWNNVTHTSIPPFLVYSPKVDEGVKEIHRILPSGGEMYHGKTSKNKKPVISRKFMDNDITHLVCTSAFGMGVNKPDIHFTSHVGMPYTLQEIYQMFGRTARGSRWTEGKPFKNGNCIAFVSKKIQPLKYKRYAIPPKLFERLYWSILNGKSTPGFFLFALPNHRSSNSFWEPNSRDIWLKNKNDKLIKNGKPILSDNDVIKRWDIARRKRRESNEDFTVRSLLSLERSGLIKIRGIHPLIPVFNREGEDISLIKLLENGGYENVMDLIGLVGKNGLSLNSEDRKYIVAEVIKPISSINEIIHAFTEADLDQERFHNQAQDELVRFFTSEECVRKRFAPIVGKKTNEVISCIESYIDNSLNPLDKSLAPIVPCYICRSREDKISSEYISDELKYNSSNPCLWLDNKSIEILSGRENQANNNPHDIFGEIKDIPLDGFIIEYPLKGPMNPKVDINTIFIKKIIKEFPGLINKEMASSIHNFKYYTKIDGVEETGICEFSLTVGKINTDMFIVNKRVLRFNNSSDLKHFKDSYGILCYRRDNKLYIRDFGIRDAKRIYLSLSKKNNSQHLESKYNCVSLFLAGPVPDIGEGTNNWRDLSIL